MGPLLFHLRIVEEGLHKQPKQQWDRCFSFKELFGVAREAAETELGPLFLSVTLVERASQKLQKYQ